MVKQKFKKKNIRTLSIGMIDLKVNVTGVEIHLSNVFIYFTKNALESSEWLYDYSAESILEQALTQSNCTNLLEQNTNQLTYKKF